MSPCGRGNFRVGRVARLSTCRLFTAIFSSFFPPTIIYARRAASHVYTVYDIPYRVIRCRRRRRCPVKRVLSCERQPSAVRAADHRFRSHALPVVYLIFFFSPLVFVPRPFCFFFRSSRLPRVTSRRRTMADKDNDEVELTIADEAVVTKYKTAGEIANRKWKAYVSLRTVPRGVVANGPSRVFTVCVAVGPRRLARRTSAVNIT